MLANPAPHSVDRPFNESLNGPEIAVDIRVKGTVQGVGFRPMVYQLAIAHHLRGEVYNDGAGVVIRVAGHPDRVEAFTHQLRTNTPPLARIESLERRDVAIASIPQTQFEITASRSGPTRTQVAPDAATCPQCLADTLDPFSRFYRYPFTNCTHCGPRLSIIRTIPYDRGNTSMASFPMCPDCRDEYENPLNRRFHAQPVACHRCGPHAWLERADGRPIVPDMFSMLDAVDAVCTLLQRGEIVGIKGIGGIHLACDATNDEAVRQLRQRKHRYHKPLALMVRDLSVIEPYCKISDAERALLQSPAAPIVLLQKHPTPHTPHPSSLPPSHPSPPSSPPSPPSASCCPTRRSTT